MILDSILLDYEQLNTDIYSGIERYKKLIQKQEDEIAEKQIIIDSLTASLVREIRSITIPYSDKMMNAAWNQQRKATKEERRMYEFIEEDLIQRLFEESERDKVKLTNIIPVNYDHCVYNFWFEYNGITFELGIPNVKRANNDNIDHMHYGEYILRYEKSPNFWDSITSSYRLDDIAVAIKEFCEKKGVANDSKG